MDKRSPKQWLSVKELVAEYGMSEPFWNRLRCRGGGPTFSKIGNSVRYQRQNIDRYFEQQQRETTQTPVKANAPQPDAPSQNDEAA